MTASLKKRRKDNEDCIFQTDGLRRERIQKRTFRLSQQSRTTVQILRTDCAGIQARRFGKDDLLFLKIRADTILCPPRFSPDAMPDCFAIRPKKEFLLHLNGFFYSFFEFFNITCFVCFMNHFMTVRA